MRASTVSRIGGALTVAWLCGIGQAWAGSGASADTLRGELLNPLCQFLGISPVSCPQLPTVVQIVQEVAGLDNAAPNFISSEIIGVTLGLDQTSGACTVAGNAFVPCNTLAVNAVNPLARSSIGPSDLSSLTPVAFMSMTTQAKPVPLGTNGENSFFYAVTSGDPGQHTLDLFFDYPGWTQKQFAKGQSVATITLPLVTFDGTRTETPVLATLNVSATCNGAAACLTGIVTGIPGTTSPPSAAQLGIQFGYQFGSSPNSQTPHGVLEVTLPVVVTLANDPAYFGVSPLDGTMVTLINQSSGLPTAFSNTEAGFAAKVLGTGVSVGVAPYAAPLCTSTSCPSDPMTTPITNYGFCASVGGTSTVAAFVSIGTDGTTYTSSQVAAPQPVCPTANATAKVAAQ